MLNPKGVFFQNIGTQRTVENKIPQTVGYYLAFISLGLVAALLGPTLTKLAAQTSSPINEISILISARAFGYMIGSLISGNLYDRFPGHPVLFGVMMVIALVVSAVPFVYTLWLLIVLMFIMGIADGTLDVGGNTMLIWTHDDKVGPFMNALHFFWGVGAWISPIIVAVVLSLMGGIAGAYWLVALCLLPPALYLLRLPSPPPLKHTNAEGRASRKTDYRLVALISLFFFLYVGGESGFGSWVAAYTFKSGMTSEANAAYLASAFWGALTVGRLLSVPITARIDLRTVILGDLLVCIASGLMMVLIPNSFIAIILGALGLGLGMASVFPTMLSLAGKVLTITGRINGFFFAGASAGGMILPWVVGQYFEKFGPWVTPFFILSFVTAGLVIYILIYLYFGKKQNG